MHKDGIIFTMLGLFCYAFYFSLRDRLTTGRILLLAVSAITLLLTRSYVLIAMLPAAIAMWLANKKTRPFKTFVLVYAICFCMVILISLLSSQPLQIITQKQKDFFDLPVATSQMAMDTLQPTLSGFAANTPQAAEHGLLRPYVWEFPGTFLMAIAIELLVFQLLFFYMLSRPRLSNAYMPFVYFGIFFSLTLLLFAGYIVPNAGSLVRYRSIYLPFLLTPILFRISQNAKFKNIL